MLSSAVAPQPMGSVRRTQAAPRATAAPEQPVQQPSKQPVPKLISATRRQLVVGGVVGTACACCPTAPAQASGDWNYTYPGPAAWEGTCADGLNQSPIDIPISRLQPIRFKYPDTVRANVINNGHGSPQVNIVYDPTGPACEIDLDGEIYQLIQYHFHAPSEHTFNGMHTVMEVHLVHKSVATGDLAVLGVMLSPGSDKPNAGLETALTTAPGITGVEIPIRGVNIKSLLPYQATDGRRPYATYAGSLTTPPCSEGVRWIVFLDPLKVQASQVLDFLTFANRDGNLSYNARPTQPLGNRTVRFFV